MKESVAVGLMSGTSADGIDAALIKIFGDGADTKIELIAFDSYPFSKEIRDMVFAASDPDKGNVDLICNLNFELGNIFARAAIAIIEKTNLSKSNIDFIGSHGQTIRHLPEGLPYSVNKIPSTLQIGEPSVIAEMTGIKTVADFRTRDMAAGGVGAPLAPFAHFLLFHNKSESRIVHNVGGISNLTFLPKGGNIDDLIAFDTGPGNMLIDGLISYLTKGNKKFDKDGKTASKGKVNEKLLQNLMEHPFINKKPPKATGREEFGELFLNKIINKGKEKNISDDDLMATATSFTVESIIANYEENIFKIDKPSEIIFCGGGVHNRFLMEMLREKLPQIEIISSEKFGINPDALEAISFAILANETINGNCSNLPTVTGARRKVVLGKIVEA